MKCYIVDDMPASADFLTKYITSVPFLELAGVEHDPGAALAFLLEADSGVDLVFLDIEMPGISGLDIARAIAGKYPFVFTTGHTRFALEAYDVEALDYLVKPFPFSRFMRAIERAGEYLERGNRGDQRRPYLFIPGNGKGELVKVNKADILYVKSDKNYVLVVTTKSEHYSYLSIGALEEHLDGPSFSRIHRCYIINLEKILKLDTFTVTMVDNTELPISQSYRAGLLAKINPSRPGG